ncbi:MULTISPECIES: septum formation initiator family protein [Streptococcus]|uniref:FtsB family cell division protein n=1 Tax=Streptococcus TaxID=1301 RepID=UPI0003734228|nr:septum formation initiator family protein [Streptococcus entericus]
MKTSKVVQINNEFIQDEQLKRRYQAEETKKHHRFLGVTMVLIVLLFILPTYNMVASYVKLNEKKAEIETLKQAYKDVQTETAKQKELARRLQNEEYVEKYARAKYYYSLEGETVYLLPDLLPK